MVSQDELAIAMVALVACGLTTGPTVLGRNFRTNLGRRCHDGHPGGLR